jgi:hypothetical protein
MGRHDNKRTALAVVMALPMKEDLVRDVKRFLIGRLSAALEPVG